MYTKLFGLILPLGFIFVLFIDYIVEQKGIGSALWVTNGLGAVYNDVLAMVPVLSLQAVVFFTFTGFRAFGYAVL